MISLPLQSVFVTDDGLTFVFFIAFSLMLVLGLRFGLYGYLNRRSTTLESQVLLWDYLIFVGVMAALYGLLGLLEVVTAVTQSSAVTTPFRDGVFLGFLFMLALTMREIYDNDALTNTNPGSDDGLERSVRTEKILAVMVVVSIIGTAVVGSHIVMVTINGVAAVVVASYGLVYARGQLARSSVHGTMIDSLLRHLMPVLAFGLLVLAIGLIGLVGVNDVIVTYIQVVFVIMTATTLMTATIKLRQNVASM